MSEIKKFRKKPVVIEAVQFNGTHTQARAIDEWMNGGEYVKPGQTTNSLCKMEIESLEGTMIAQAGDWIIKGVKGEFYPCKPDIFAATYEPVDAGRDPAELDEIILSLKSVALSSFQPEEGEACDRCSDMYVVTRDSFNRLQDALAAFEAGAK